MRLSSLRVWVIPALLFHVALFAVLWRVHVPVPDPDRSRLTLQLLPARPGGTPVSRIMAEPQLHPQPVPRPYLLPPPLSLEPSVLMPGPFPMDERQIQVLLAQPVLPYPAAPAAAATGTDAQPILYREPPAPVLP